jgi:hypothetical protein
VSGAIMRPFSTLHSGLNEEVHLGELKSNE